MKTKLLLLLFCLSVLGAMGQGTISRNKCKTCGKAVSQCPYKGKHPKPKPEPKPTPKPKTTPTPAPRVSATYQNNVLRVGNVSYRMVYVSGGTFTMGATSEMTTPSDFEKPIHQVTLSNYYIGETEVTQALWKAVMGSNPSYFKGDNLPVETVSWDDCQTFIRKLNELTGQHFRLPTEAEWEFAARGGNQSRHTQYSGSNRIDDVAWYDGNSDKNTHPVKTKQPNELGIYDMTGNVWEWCQDRFGDYSNSTQTNPTGASSGSFRVFRGGSWYYDPRFCRSSSRYFNTPGHGGGGLGLRLVLSEWPETSSMSTPKPTPSTTLAPRVSASYKNNVLRVGNVSYRLIPVSGGTFTMGATSEMTEPWDDEKPTHQVTLSSYYIGETEVTQALWKAVMGSNPSYFKGDNLPVETVSWDDCQTFIRKLNALTGQHFRLPTEAEWEFAARGGNQSRHTQYSGSSRIDDVAWYENNSVNKTHPVKTKQPNELGIYDMSGNVDEWCQDRYGNYSSSSQTNPTGASSGSDRVYRLGNWAFNPRNCRSSCRSKGTPDFEISFLGLRLVLSE